MELKYRFIIIIGIIVVIALCVVRFKRNMEYKGGKKVAAVVYSKANRFVKRRYRIYRILTAILMFSCLTAIGVSFFMMSRPYRMELEYDEKYGRDIILCIDISSSVDDLNSSLLGGLKETVQNLEGDRFGIIIFNTTPAVLVPLTDDYEYILEVLDTLSEALESMDYTLGYGSNYGEWEYLYNYLYEGTSIGAYEYGSSLIGDGLASAASSFSKLQGERTKIVIFSTDNSLEGVPIFSLNEAATYCKEQDVTVFGIGTRWMEAGDREEMKAAVEMTGGKFFLEEDGDSMESIVSEIDMMSKNLVKAERKVRNIELIEIPFYILLCAVGTMILITKVTRR